MESDNLEEIRSKVSYYIEGKHGRIGIIPPDRKSTEEEKREFYHLMVTLAINRLQKEKEAEE